MLLRTWVVPPRVTRQLRAGWRTVGHIAAKSADNALRPARAWRAPGQAHHGVRLGAGPRRHVLVVGHGSTEQ